MTESVNRKFAKLGLGVSSTGTITVNSATASTWQNARTITLSGDLSGNVSIDGSENVTLTATVANNTVALGTDTTGNYVATVAAGSGISVSGSGVETADVTISIDNTVATLTGSQTLTNKTISGADNTLSNIANASLTNSTISGVSLGGTLNSLTVGTGVSLNSGTTYDGSGAKTISIGQAVGTTDNVTFAGVTADAVKIGVTTAGEVDTSSGNLTLDSFTGTTVMDDDVNVTGNMLIDGNLTVSGTTVTVNATNLAVEDNMIYLNNGSAVANPDLGFAGNYNDGTYRHAGVFRDASDGVWKFFHQYVPEPDASAYIDITDVTFALAPIQASAVTATTFTGTLSGAAPAGSLSGSTLASGVTASSLTSVGTLSSLTVSGKSLNERVVVGTSGSTNDTSGAAVTLQLTNGPTSLITGHIDAYIYKNPSAIGDTLAHSMVFQVRPNGVAGYSFVGGSSNAVLMRLDGSGNLAVDTNTLYVDATNNGVGIGTASPSYKLHVNGTSYFADTVNFGAGTNSVVSWTTGYSDGTTLIIRGPDAGSLILQPNTSYTGIFIKSNGNVGIGTTNPGSTLSVRGSTNLGDSHDSSTTATHITRISGYALYYNASNRYGSYGNLILNATNAWTSSARRYTITNGFDSNKFAIIRSVDANTDAAINGVGGAISSGTADFVMDNAGNVGIGTTSPGANLQVNRSGNGIAQYVYNTGATSQAYVNYGNATTGLYTQAFGTPGGLLVGVDTDASAIVWQGSNNVLRFGTNNSERVRIDATGNVGIGTTDPFRKLHVAAATTANSTVNNNANVVAIFGSTTTVANAWATVKFQGDEGTGLWFSDEGGNNNHGYISCRYTGQMDFATGNDSTSAASVKMTILTGGNVGIGTTSPSQQLHLTGYARLLGISVNETGGTISAFIGYEKAWTGVGSSNSLAIASETSNSIKFYTNGTATLKMEIDTTGHVLPGTNGTQNLGSASLRWATVYTSDLSLSNGIGDWTIVEGEDDLFIYNNKNNKVYKFTLQEVDSSTATPKKS